MCAKHAATFRRYKIRPACRGKPALPESVWRCHASAHRSWRYLVSSTPLLIRLIRVASQGTVKYVHHLIDMCTREYERRRNDEFVHDRAQHHAGGNAQVRNLSGVTIERREGLSGLAVLHQLDRDHESPSSDIADYLVLVANRRELLQEIFA